MRRHGGAAQETRAGIGQQRRAAEQAAGGIAPAERQHQLARRAAADAGEVAPVGVGDRQHVEHGGGDQRGRQQRVLPVLPRPGLRVQAKQAGKRTRRGGQFGGRSPDDAAGRIGGIGHPQGSQRPFNRRCALAVEGAAPQRAGETAQDRLTRFSSGIRPTMQQLHNRHQHGGHSRACLAGVVADHLPAGRGSERRAFRQHAPPGFGQGVQGSAGRRGQRDKAAQPRLRQAPQ